MTNKKSDNNRVAIPNILCFSDGFFNCQQIRLTPQMRKQLCIPGCFINRNHNRHHAPAKFVANFCEIFPGQGHKMPPGIPRPSPYLCSKYVGFFHGVHYTIQYTKIVKNDLILKTIPMSKKHPVYGYMSKHHLIPKHRLRIYYGETFRMPHNRLRLWRVRHDAWHTLFGNKTINEIIRYLGGRVDGIRYYRKKPWQTLFKDLSAKSAKKLLIRTRNIIRKRYAHLEFDPKLRDKVKRIEKYMRNRVYGRIYLDKRFLVRA